MKRKEAIISTKHSEAELESYYKKHLSFPIPEVANLDVMTDNGEEKLILKDKKSILCLSCMYDKLEETPITSIKIPCFITHKLKEGYTINLKKVPIKNSVYICTLNEDGTIGSELKYGKHKSKYRYSLSGSILHLPLYLNNDKEVIIKYEKKIQCYSFGNNLFKVCR